MPFCIRICVHFNTICQQIIQKHQSYDILSNGYSQQYSIFSLRTSHHLISSYFARLHISYTHVPINSPVPKNRYKSRLFLFFANICKEKTIETCMQTYICSKKVYIASCAPSATSLEYMILFIFS